MGLCLLLFATALNTMSYRKLEADTYVHASLLHTFSPIRQLNYAMGFGKPIAKYYGLPEMIDGIRQASGDILGVAVLDTKGTVIEHSTGIDEGEWTEGAQEEYRIADEGIYAYAPFDGGQLVLLLDAAPVYQETKSCLKRLITYDVWILLGIVIALLLVTVPDAKTGVNVRKMRMVSVLLLVASQMVLGGSFIRYVGINYAESVEQIARTAAGIVEKDINAVVDKGIAYRELTGLKQYLDNLSSDMPEISQFTLSDGQEQTAAATADWQGQLSINGQKEKLPLQCEYDQELVQKNRFNTLIDILILIMVSIFISLESVSFFANHLEQKDQKKSGELYMPGFRLFVFAFGVAFTLDTGFFSILSARLYDAMELPDKLSFLSGAPNTMYSVAVLLGLFGCSTLLSRLGMRRTLLLGVWAGIIGYALCALAGSLPVLIVARFIYGFCDGLIINAIRLYASSQEDSQMHTKLLVEYMAAINLGVCCSVVIGGLIADAASYTAVFALGILLGVFCLFLIRFAGFTDEKSQRSMSFLGAIRDMRIPRVFLFMVFVVVPIYVATLFVSYTFPLFGDEIGFSNSMVSGCLMINFLVVAYLTDPLSAWVLGRVKPRRAILSYMLLQAASIALFVVTASAWTALVALVLTSIWDCFGMVVMDSVLDDVEGTATDRNTLLQMIFGKVGMAVGPIAITSRLKYGSANATGVIVVLLVLGFAAYLVMDTACIRKEKGKG